MREAGELAEGSGRPNPHTAGDYARRSNRQTRLAEQREKEVRTADRFLRSEIEFQAPLRPGSPPAVVLYGDMTKQGLYVYRVKFPAGFKVMPHWHGEERTFVVLSGTLHMGIGESWDETKLKAYPAGSFLSEPPKLPHFTWAKDGEVILQITGIGPASTTSIPAR
jgi:uncharacterized RmlC-like cupin family protein